MRQPPAARPIPRRSLGLRCAPASEKSGVNRTHIPARAQPRSGSFRGRPAHAYTEGTEAAGLEVGRTRLGHLRSIRCSVTKKQECGTSNPRPALISAVARQKARRPGVVAIRRSLPRLRPSLWRWPSDHFVAHAAVLALRRHSRRRHIETTHFRAGWVQLVRPPIPSFDSQVSRV